MKKKRLLQTHIQKEKTQREVNNRKTKRQTDWESIKQVKGVSFFKTEHREVGGEGGS